MFFNMPRPLKYLLLTIIDYSFSVGWQKEKKETLALKATPLIMINGVTNVCW